MLDTIKIEQKVKSFFHNGGFVSASLLEEDIKSELPDGVVILDVVSEWYYPTYSKRREIVKELEYFDPIKLEISKNFTNYKFNYIASFLKSWRIRGPNIDESGGPMEVESLPLDLVDIMYYGMDKIAQNAEENLGKV